MYLIICAKSKGVGKKSPIHTMKINNQKAEKEYAAEVLTGEHRKKTKEEGFNHDQKSLQNFEY